MARATAPSTRPPSALAAASSPASAAAAASLGPQRRATAGGARSQAHEHHRVGAVPVPVLAAPRGGRRDPRGTKRASCACSPTTHPGSFRCALHRGQQQAGGALPAPIAPAPPPVSSRLSAPRRASMANPLVRIAAVEGGDHIRRALAALVRPSSQRRRADAFRPTPSRLSAMSSAAAHDEPSPGQ